MNKSSKLDLDLGTRVQTFLATYWNEITPHLGASLPSLELFKSKLDAAVADVESIIDHKGMSLQKNVVRTRKHLRTVLFKTHLRSLQRISQLIREDFPENGPVIDMPPDSENEVVLLEAAKSAIQVVQHNQSLFEQYGLAENTISEIQNIVSAIRNGQETKRQLVIVRVGVGAGSRSGSRRVKRIVKCIAPMLNPVFEVMGDRGKIAKASWESASRRHQAGVFVVEEGGASTGAPVHPTTAAA